MIKKVQEILGKYINGEYNIKELQSRLRNIPIQEPDSDNWNAILCEIDNQLEEIIFTKLPENQYAEVMSVFKSILSLE